MCSNNVDKTENSATAEQSYVNSEVLNLSGIGASPKVDMPALEYASLQGQSRDRESQVKSVTIHETQNSNGIYQT